METTHTRIDLDTRERLRSIVSHRFGPSEPSFRETLHILIKEEIDRLDVADPVDSDDSG